MKRLIEMPNFNSSVLRLEEVSVKPGTCVHDELCDSHHACRDVPCRNKVIVDCAVMHEAKEASDVDVKHYLD